MLTPFNGGLAVTRHLVRAGVDVRVLAGRSDAFTSRTRGVDGRVLSDLPGGRVEWMEALASAGDAVVMTGGDVGSAFLASERAALAPALRTFEGQDDVHEPLMGKRVSFDLATAAGVRVPWTASVSSQADLDRVLEQAPYPCVLKPDFSHLWRAVFGDDRVLLAQNRDELAGHGRRALGGGLDLLVSEYVPGGDTAMEEAIVVRAADGSYPVAFGCHKLRQYPSGFGAASLCEVTPAEESLDLARRLLDHVGFVGVAGIETKRHADTGDYYFIEANVRIPTQFGLGDAAGGDSAWRMYASLAGIDVSSQPPLEYGVRLVFPELEIRGALRSVRGRDGSAGPFERLRSYRRVRDWGIADLRDPRPALSLARGFAGRRLSRAIHRG
jgi:predicted ATP-grasp superfamily ATP-dependent carboligase